MTSDSYPGSNGFMDAFKKTAHSSHPDFGHLTMLVFEAVMEVVCVSLPGYIIARMGMFDADAQKFVANLNTQLFTPCLSMWKIPDPCSPFRPLYTVNGVRQCPMDSCNFSQDRLIRSPRECATLHSVY